MRVNWVGVRNVLIIAGIAALIGFGYNYFRQNELAWLVLKPWQRYLIIACVIGIALLLLLGFPLLSDHVTPLGVLALIAVLVLVIVWVVRESRRFR